VLSKEELQEDNTTGTGKITIEQHEVIVQQRRMNYNATTKLGAAQPDTRIVVVWYQYYIKQTPNSTTNPEFCDTAEHTCNQIFSDIWEYG